ncbi:hypothetical protein [Candidatus Oleimmundimicrobium sp.]|uniref:hypothetical protein n=1 Tax=Candidatus Oleimmundimicrobium sp. TaxID=3060597 RepID=UPI002722DB1E|nr:hypothetical protein [Candidatus Oleimmundimicrobium sp.]MDO8886277.1 hypothetical protein [Candidatus Oleimmundimicrobium sp.]
MLTHLTNDCKNDYACKHLRQLGSMPYGNYNLLLGNIDNTLIIKTSGVFVCFDQILDKKTVLLMMFLCSLVYLN